ncbi:hypothetical protein JXB41_04295 [Candidatus Woesearchaeota archaeon]|nr:hypothetical protein [Candidatus Woesearchaeota archaeon]
MENKDKFYVFIFIGLFSIILIYMGSSITGWLIQSMYCNDEGCTNFCRINQDCSIDEVCCQAENTGICKLKTECTQLYKPSFESGVEIDVDINAPVVEQPGKITEPWIYLVLIMLVLAIGIVCFLRKKKK